MIAKWPEIKPLLVEGAADIMCFQETHFLATDEYDFRLPNYTLYNGFSDSNRRQGGVCIYVSNNFPHFQVTLTTTLQALACSVRIGRSRLCFCSLYLPPTDTFTLPDLTNLINQLPQPFVLCADANSRHLMWGSDRCDTRGNIWERVIRQNALYLLNDGCPTRLDEYTGLWSHIDITVATSSLGQYLDWHTDSELHASDHCPIYITYDGVGVGNTGLPHEGFRGWNLNRANWTDFASRCDFHGIDYTDVASAYERMVGIFMEAARETIPQKTGSSKYSCPWWNDDCKEAIRTRKRALNRFRRSRRTTHLMAYKAAKANARRTIRQAKKDSWGKLLHMFNISTPLHQLWGIIRKFTRKERYHRPLPVLRVADDIVDDPFQVANVLGRYFSDISSSMHQRPLFRIQERAMVERMPSFVSANDEVYNDVFTLRELQESISACGTTSVGPDSLHYSFFKHLNADQLQGVLTMINNVWCMQTFPTQWKHSILIPILKPGKPRDNPGSYRPIQLTSCFCKLMERMVARRLTWFIEENNILSAFQSAFRKGRCTADHLIRLESEVRRGFFYNKYTVAVFLDLKSAYNLTSKTALLHRMYDLGFRGRLMFFIQAYLTDRTFQVRNRVLSDTFRQENGLVQGGVISPILFNILIDDIFHNVPSSVSCSLYADDCSMWVQGRRLLPLVNTMQTALDRVTAWTDRWGFVFSPNKCNAMIFRRYMNARELDNVPDLTIYDDPITYTDDVKFLGVILDTRLNLTKHVQYIKGKAAKRISLLKCLAGRGCGADRATLIRIYKSMIRPILDYSCQILDGPQNKIVESLEAVQNECLRIATGALRTSPVLPLLIETDVLPLRLRRGDLTLRYCMKVRSRPGHPCMKLTTGESALHAVEWGYMKRISGFPLYERITQLCEETGFVMPELIAFKQSSIPPWKLLGCDILKLTDKRKGLISDLNIQCEFNDVREKYADHSFIFTDGAKTHDGVGCAFVHGSRSRQFGLPVQCSIFTAEAVAVLQALSYIAANQIMKCVICSDSLSVITALLHPPSENPIVTDILDYIHRLVDSGHSLVIMWIPGHSNIAGNETADVNAKAAISNDVVYDVPMGVKEFGPALHQKLRELFNQLWLRHPPQTVLKSVKDRAESWETSKRPNRREEIVLCRLRLGHTRYTHSYIINRDPRPECVDCGCPLTVQHILVDCPAYADQRRQLTRLCQEQGTQLCLKSLLGNDYPNLIDEVFNYLRACDLLKHL